MKKQSLVSVIIPTYNREKCIRRAIESVLDQTYQNVELIVVDDGSTDNTKEILEPFIKSGKIKYFYQPNRGPATARNLGIKNSKGEFIALLDSDDEWLPEKLEKQIGLFQNSKDEKLGFVGCNIIFINEITNKTIEYKIPRYKNFFRFLLSEFMWPPQLSTIITKKQIIEEVGLFDEKVWFGEDLDMWIRIAKKYNFDFVLDCLTKIHLHPTSLSFTTKPYKITKSYDYITQKYKQDYQRFPKIYSTRLRLLGSLYYRAGDVEKGRKLFLESIKVNSLNLKSYFYFFLSLFGPNFYNKLYCLTLPFRGNKTHRFINVFINSFLKNQ